jgi:HEAT repeat protein
VWLIAHMDYSNADEVIARYLTAPDPSALSGLSQVDWANLEHSYGSASDVPALLRALCSPDADERDFAIHELFLKIRHQGDVLTASVTAVPFLFRLLDSPDTQDKAGIAELLAAIGHRRGRISTVDFQAWNAVGTRLPLLFPYIQDPNLAVREGVAQVLGDYPDQAKACLPVLRHAAKTESDAEVRQALQESIRKLDGAKS